MHNQYNTRNCIYEGRVLHSRKKPKKHSFKYHVFYIYVNLKLIKHAKISSFFSVNKFNLYSFYDRDHGDKNCKDIEKWVRNLVKKNGIKVKIKDIYLLTFPRVLGYVFNPLSVYNCLDEKKKIVLQIYEVHNTFKERYFYLVKNTFNKTSCHTLSVIFRIVFSWVVEKTFDMEMVFCSYFTCNWC